MLLFWKSGRDYIRDLDSADLLRRTKAADWLASHRDPSLVKLLMARLKFDSPCSDLVARILSSWHDEASLESLLTATKDKDRFVRNVASDIIVRRKDPGAAERLVKLAVDREEATESRECAIHALGRLGWGRWVSVLLQLLDDPNEDIQISAVLALGRAGSKEDAERLSKFLGHNNQILRQCAAISMGMLGDARAKEVLLEILDSPQDARKGDAARAYIQLYPKQVTPVLRSLKKTKDKDEKRYLIDALEAAEDPEASETLLPLIEDFCVGYYAVQALVKLGDVRSIPALKHALTFSNDITWEVFNATDTIKKAISALETRYAHEREMAQTKGSSIATPQPVRPEPPRRVEGRHETEAPLTGALFQVVILAPSRFRINEWDVLRISIKNRGPGTARRVRMSLRGPLEAEGQHIGDLAPGQARELQLGIRFTEAGPSVPVALFATYDNEKSEAWDEAFQLFLDVATLGEAREMSATANSTIVVHGAYYHGPVMSKSVGGDEIWSGGAKATDGIILQKGPTLSESAIRGELRCSCGAKIERGWKVCPFCGKRLDS